jgi:diketogulonate reductase-like aldo/keto reductase
VRAVDLYLIHGPIGGRQARKESWEACVAARKAGLARSVGISTFGVRQMQELLADVPGEIPAVNQVREKGAASAASPLMRRAD